MRPTMLALAATLAAAPASAQAPPSRPQTLLPAGPFHTAGNQIVDADGTPVRLACVGLNQPHFEVPMSMQARTMVEAGFNCIRMSWVNATMDADLATIDRVVAAVSGTGLRLILDNHTNERGTPADGYGSQQKNGLWFDKGPGSDGTNGAGVTGTVTDARFLADWEKVARRYAGNHTVIGYDIRNEPLGYKPTNWGEGGPRDIHAMYTRVGNALQAIDADPLVIAEGPGNWVGSFTDRGPAPEGDLTMAEARPVRLNVPNKVVYSVHLYPNFKPNSGSKAVARMNAAWGYLVTKQLAPVWIGEMGASLDGSNDAGDDLATQKAWAATLVPYLNGEDGARGGPTFTAGQQGVGTDWWAWGHLEGQSPNGTLKADWRTLRPEQAAVYRQLRQAPAARNPAKPPTGPARPTD